MGQSSSAWSFPRGGAQALQEIWCFNCGGLAGFWKLSHFLAAMEPSLRPLVVCVQEFTCDDREIVGISNYWCELGFQIHDGRSSRYCSRGRLKGVVTFVSGSTVSQKLHLLELQHGAALCVSVSDFLLINCYVIPDSSGVKQMEYMTTLGEMIQSISWTRHLVLCGDFNEESIGWIGTFAQLHGLTCLLPSVDSTRSSGNKILDFFVVSSILSCDVFALDAKLSDHRVVGLRLELNAWRHKEMKFKSMNNFSRPLWLSDSRWQALFDEAVSLGSQSQWAQVAYDISHQDKWIFREPMVSSLQSGDRTCPSDRCYRDPGSWGDVPSSSVSLDVESLDVEQDVVDYGWEVFSRMFLWALQVSCFLALLEIPEDFNDSAEICRVEKLYNEKQSRGTGRLVNKPQFRCGRASNVCMHSLRKRSGRMHELQTKFEKQACHGGISALSCGLYGKLVTAEENKRELSALNEKIEEMDRRSKIDALIHWRHRLQTKKGVKGKWLQPNVLPRLVKIRRGDAFTSTKEEALMVLRDHWMGLIDSVAWEQDDRERETAKLTRFLSSRLPSDTGIRRPVSGSSVDLPSDLLIGRPDSGSFAEAIKNVRGCPGIDGWSSEEISLLCGNKFMLGKAWDEMANWEQMGLAPSSMRDGLLHFIPKPGKVGADGCCTCKDLRPLSILSVFWRAWSGAWVKSSMMTRFVHHFLPRGLIASFKGGYGCESLASAMAHELSRLGFGATLDYSFCFDTIDLKLLKDSISASLPTELVSWSGLVFDVGLAAVVPFCTFRFSHHVEYHKEIQHRR